jgi:hypothetical protein
MPQSGTHRAAPSAMMENGLQNAGSRWRESAATCTVCLTDADDTLDQYHHFSPTALRAEVANRTSGPREASNRFGARLR